jgi:hypothetical protein
MPPLSTALVGGYGPPWAGAVSSLFAFVALLMGLAAQRKTEASVSDGAVEAVAK